jgi:hypothetical protein
MKRRILGWKSTAAIGVALAAFVGGSLIWLNIHGKEREIARLRAAIENLTASYPIAHLLVLNQSTDEDGGTRTRVRVIFVDDQGRRTGEPVEAVLAGTRIRFEALLMIFEDPLVERGERRTMAFPTRIYSESVAPDKGVELAALDPEGVPTVFAPRNRSPRELAPAEYKKILARFWYYANHPDEAAEFGIDVQQGQAVFTEYDVKRYYTVYVETDAGLTIRPELIWWEE